MIEEATCRWADTREDVRLSGFTPTTYDLVAGLAEDLWGHPQLSVARPTRVPMEHAAALVFILRSVPDDEFPGGKWATIQHLESLVEQAVGA